jgi:hypothetical protein
LKTAALFNNLPQTAESDIGTKSSACVNNVIKPMEEGFNLQQNEAEYQTMVGRLMGAGSLPNKVKQIIAR